MSDPRDAFAPSDPLSREQLDRMVRDLRPEWRVRGATALEEGSDAVYALDVATGGGGEEGAPDRRAILKCAGFTDLGTPLVESRVLSLVAEHTPIPVPEVYGFRADHPDLASPFLLTEFREGDTVEYRDLSPAAVERVAREAGRNLGHLHAFSVTPPAGLELDGYGGLVHDDEDAGTDTDAGERGVVRVADPDVSWREWREEVLTFTFDRLADTRFADDADWLRAAAERRLPSLDDVSDPVLCHADYRYGNLLVDPGMGETRAVLDWGAVVAAPPLDDLVSTEQYLCGRAPLDSPDRRRVRSALRAGYESVRGAALDPDRAERDCYLLLSQLAAMCWFPVWYADRDEAEKDRLAAQFRQFVRNLG